MSNFKKFEDWDARTKRVQNDIAAGKYVSGKTTLIAFGPPEFKMIATAANTDISATSAVTNDNFLATTGGWEAPIPCGEVQGFSQQQQSQLIKLFEIGSERSIVVRGRTFGALQINRVLYNGANLLKYLYLYYTVKGEGDGAKIGGNINTDRLSKILSKKGGKGTITVEANAFGTAETEPMENNLFWTLNSALFSIPVGIMLYLKDTLDKPFGAVYFENCYINSHSASLDEGSPIITEGVSIEFERCLSLKVTNS